MGLALPTPQPFFVFLLERPVCPPKPMWLGEMLAGARTPPYTVAPPSPSCAPLSLVDEPKIQGIGDEGDPPQTVQWSGQGEVEVGCHGEAGFEEAACLPKGAGHKEVRYGGALARLEGTSAPGSSAWSIGWDRRWHNRHERVW